MPDIFGAGLSGSAGASSLLDFQVALHTPVLQQVIGLLRGWDFERFDGLARVADFVLLARHCHSAPAGCLSLNYAELQSDSVRCLCPASPDGHTLYSHNDSYSPVCRYLPVVM